MQRLEYEFQVWERGLIAASALLFFVALALYIAEYPLLTSLSEGTVRVGELSDKSGSVRRELMTDDLFRKIERSAPLYENDTVVTDSASTATIQLDGGASIQLEPNSMVRLAFLNELTLTGISRVPRVDVVSGKVTGRGAGKAKPVRIATRNQMIEIADTDAQAVETATVTPFIPARPVAPVEEVTPPPTPEEIASPPIVVPPPAAAGAPITPVAMQPPTVNPALMRPADQPLAQASRVPEVLPSAAPSVAAAPSAVPSAIPSAAAPVAFDLKGLKHISVLFPKAKARLRVPPGSKNPAVNWDMKWVGKPAKLPIKVSLYRLKKNGEGVLSREELFTRIVKTTGKPMVTTHLIDSPGEYEWELQGPNGESLAAIGKSFVQFTVEREFVGIHPKEPSVGGKKASGSNRVGDRVLKDFDVQLSWEPYGEVEDYKVWIASSPDAKKPLIEKTVSKRTNFALNKDQVFKGRMFYRVKGELPNGWVVTSPIKPFIFDFLP
ncbi:MAG TPA: FecR domain-containing protein, partial [Bdellovibrionota bacterium]|nr:FecR domain-containing protein [Bdellovibrionota bacterium]